jgi:hypothetical protein
MCRSLSLKNTLGVAALLLLAACGGGGGGDAGSGPSGQTPQNGLLITTDKNELRFISLNQAYPSEDAITFSLAGAQASATYYAMAEPDTNAGFDTYILNSTLTSITVGLRARNASPSINGAINFKLCKDEKCASVAWSRSIPYRIRTYTIDTREVALTGYEGAVSTETRAVSPAPAPGDLRVTGSSIYYNGSAPNWLSGSIDAAGRLVISGSGAGVAKGNYTGDLYISSASGQAPGVAIRVSMSVGVGVVLPADGAVTIDTKSPALINASMNLSFKGEQSPSWSVTSDKPWLVPVAASGTGAGPVGYTVDTTKLASLPNFTPESAQLNFKIAGHPDTSYKVVVEKKLPEILALSPSQLMAGRASEVRLRGRGLNQLGSVAGITLNGTAFSSGTIISDTEATVNVASLAAGSYALAIPSAPAIAQPRLDVVNAPQLTAAVIDSVGTKAGLVYSALRNAMYTVDRDHGKLLRYSLVNGAWTLDKSLAVEPSTRIGLSHDERTLYTNNGGYIIEERDADTLAVKASYEFKSNDIYGVNLFDYVGRELPITNDGRIWFGSSQWSDAAYFDTKKKTFVRIVSRIDIPQSLYSPVFVVSRDGSRMIAESQYEPTLRYDVSTGKLETAASNYATGNSGTVLSGNGKYVLNGVQRMYEVDTWRFVGLLPESVFLFAPRLLSNDGSRIYVGVRNETGTDVALTRIDVLDSASMSKVGEIPLSSETTNCDSSGSYGCVTPGNLRLTPFGDAIIWFGNKKISVIPVPKNLGGSVGAARFKLVK